MSKLNSELLAQRYGIVKEFAIKLRQVHDRSGVTQVEAAKALGCSKGYFHRLVQGISFASEDILKKVTEYYELPEDYFDDLLYRYRATLYGKPSEAVRINKSKAELIGEAEALSKPPKVEPKKARAGREVTDRADVIQQPVVISNGLTVHITIVGGEQDSDCVTLHGVHGMVANGTCHIFNNAQGVMMSIATSLVKDVMWELGTTN